METYKNDPREMKSKFKSTCRVCSKAIEKGEDIIYFPADKHAEHKACGQDSFNQFILSAQDEEFYKSQY